MSNSRHLVRLLREQGGGRNLFVSRYFERRIQHKKFGGHQRRFQPGGGRDRQGRDAEDQSGILGDCLARRENALDNAKTKQNNNTEYVGLIKTSRKCRTMHPWKSNRRGMWSKLIVFIGKSYGEDYHPNGHAGNFERVWALKTYDKTVDRITKDGAGIETIDTSFAFERRDGVERSGHGRIG